MPHKDSKWIREKESGHGQQASQLEVVSSLVHLTILQPKSSDIHKICSYNKTDEMHQQHN